MPGNKVSIFRFADVEVRERINERSPLMFGSSAVIQKTIGFDNAVMHGLLFDRLLNASFVSVAKQTRLSLREAVAR